MTRRLWLILFLVACTAAPPVSVETLQQGRTLYFRAARASRAKRHKEAARLWSLAASMRGYDNGYMGVAVAHYNAAFSYALAGEKELAFAQLDKAVAAGFRNPARLLSDPDFKSIQDDPRWTAVVAAVEKNSATYLALRSDPGKARFIYEDIDRFWRAYDVARRLRTPGAREKVFRVEYVERGTAGLVDYFFAKIGTTEKLVSFVNGHRRYYDSVRANTLRAREMEPQVREALRKLAVLYPRAKFPDIYFVVGRLSSGGTVSNNGLLIGTEMYSVAPDTPKDELSVGLRRIVAPSDELPHTVVHELVHFQQRGGSRFLLRGALAEGGAEFIADLVLPSPRKPFYRVWGEQHEALVWERFTADMKSADWSKWIGGNTRAPEEWPADLGYFVGYEIARRYYDRAEDKQAAIRDLLELRDPEGILKASGYADATK